MIATGAKGDEILLLVDEIHLCWVKMTSVRLEEMEHASVVAVRGLGNGFHLSGLEEQFGCSNSSAQESYSILLLDASSLRSVKGENNQGENKVESAHHTRAFSSPAWPSMTL